MCLVCKAYLALLSFAKKMRFSWDAGLSLSEESGRWISARGWVEKVLITSMDRCPSTTCKNAAKSDLSMDCWPSTTSKIAATCCHTLTCKNVAKHGLPMDRWPSTTPRNLAKPSVCLAKMLQNAACRCGVGRRQLQVNLKPCETQGMTCKNAAKPSCILSMGRWPSTTAKNNPCETQRVTCKNAAESSLSMDRCPSTTCMNAANTAFERPLLINNSKKRCRTQRDFQTCCKTLLVNGPLAIDNCKKPCKIQHDVQK